MSTPVLDELSEVPFPAPFDPLPFAETVLLEGAVLVRKAFLSIDMFPYRKREDVWVNEEWPCPKIGFDGL